ncbi:MAG: D-tyrosyl-tRNA(Tyr) deacylase [Chloroflexi bacterium HGW-Chloroflexi-8]|nr:MAG: D-tyrosyl-tRNA(Tyr) deacylase [Chloroflexi bacterium HGW-Chloroflexi-8]
MRVVIQRTTQRTVEVEKRIVASQSGLGLLLFLGVGKNDNEDTTTQLARKVANLRIFADDDGKMNLSILDIKGSAIVVSQFTLFADTKRGNRPSFIEAGEPEKAKILVELFVNQLQSFGIETQQGEFGANMQVSLVNDGPVTIWIET